MIHTSKQLKDKVRNVSKSNSSEAQAFIRNFIMERFLERVSVSKYKDQFILKGGMLVASIVGIDMRSTMDIDATVKSLPLTAKDIREIIENICCLTLEDHVTFQIKKVSEIMSDFEYPGVRIFMEARLDRLCQPFKIDISTDDIITPSAVRHKYSLMFEDRTIDILSYNIETLLAEKIQTVLNRGIANTRMRDFYDIFMIAGNKNIPLELPILKDAFWATCRKRNTLFDKESIHMGFTKLSEDQEMQTHWENFKKSNYFVEDIFWKDILEVLENVIQHLS